MSLSLSIPRQRDPVARFALLGLTGLVAWLGISQPSAPAHAEAPIILMATPTLPIAQDTAAFAPVIEQPTAAPAPSAAPVVELAAPTMPPPIIEQPIVVEQPAPIIQQIIVEQPPEVIYVEVTAVPPPPEPTMQVLPAVPDVGQALPSGSIIVQTATPAPGQPGFAESFKAPDPKATCAFVGCL